MTMTITFTGEWADIADEMRAILGTPSVTYVVGDKHFAEFEAASADVSRTAPRTRRKKAEAQVTEREDTQAVEGWTEPQVTEREYKIHVFTDEPQAHEPVYESTVTTPLVEEPAPSVDAPVETQASTSEPGSDAPASGSATPASEVAYADVVAAVTDLASAKGPEAVKQALREMGLTTAKGTAPEVWPSIIAAMREAM